YRTSESKFFEVHAGFDRAYTKQGKETASGPRIFLQIFHGQNREPLTSDRFSARRARVSNTAFTGCGAVNSLITDCSLHRLVPGCEPGGIGGVANATGFHIGEHGAQPAQIETALLCHVLDEMSAPRGQHGCPSAIQFFEL